MIASEAIRRAMEEADPVLRRRRESRELMARKVLDFLSVPGREPRKTHYQLQVQSLSGWTKARGLIEYYRNDFFYSGAIRS